MDEVPTHLSKTRRLTGLRVALGAMAAGWVLMALASSSVGARPPGGTVAPVPTGKVVFNRDIRPILADRCFACHGPDANKRQADLRLDRPETALGPLPKHPSLRAFVPGDPDHSEALRKIESKDASDVMPPSTSHLKLDDKEKALIRRWLAEGGDYQEHWAFTKPVRPPIPRTTNGTWARSDIDRLVLADLEAQGLTPSRQADKQRLIRRVSLDLTGIPPTPAEVDAFVSDSSPGAYEKVVDRLLASPRYGEQMATAQWLDAARYADSHGYQSDPERHMWRWRDWVINAFNSNMPFDEFAIEQLAGDLLPNATTDQKIATGFNRNHRINDEGGIINEEWRVEGVIDRVSTTSAVFMGLTMECCRCHDHKFDPITQKEFYSFSAYFNSINEEGAGPTGATDKGINVPPVLKLPTPEQAGKLAALSTSASELETRIPVLRKEIPERLKQLEASGGALPDPQGLVARFTLDGALSGQGPDGHGIATTFTGKGEAAFRDGNGAKAIHFDGSGTAVNAQETVHFDRKDAFSYGAWVRLEGGGAIVSKMDSKDGFQGFDLYVADDRIAVHLIHHWEDNAIKVVSTVPVPKNVWTHVLAVYDGSGKAAGVKLYFNGRPVATQVDRDALSDTIVTKSPVLIGSRDGSDSLRGDVRDVRFYGAALTSLDAAALGRGEEARGLLAVPAAARTPEQTKSLSEFAELTEPRLSTAIEQLNQIQQQKAVVEAQMPDTMVMEELPKPRDTFVLIRGEYDKLGEKVQPGVPSVLPPLPKDAPPNRLGLARWIVAPENPLTPRVLANRLWEKYFGVGLVKTSENFGTQTEWPSHPELLDYLATEVVRLKWDLKAFQKAIVMSAVYQQASDIPPDLLERDPENRLLARGPRFRLSAEQIRDQALAASGLLVEKIGGPSSRPYQPEGLWAGNAFGNLAKYVADTGDGLYRRSLYSFIKRTAVPANLNLFDQPNREYCIIRRSRTNTPLQALNLMNDTTYVEAARVLAQQVMSGGAADPGQKIDLAFKRVLCRAPTAREASVLTSGFASYLKHYRGDAAAASKLVRIGSSAVDPKLDAAELAAYTMTCSTILNLDETVTRP